MIFLKFKPLNFFILISLLNPAFAGWVELSEDIMGTRVTVESWHGTDSQALSCNGEVMANMHRIDAQMSSYKPESEISSINRDAAIAPVKVSRELYDLLQRAVEFSALSDGAFDITFASIGQHYDYRERKQPADAQIDAELANIDYQHVILKSETVAFKRAGVRIDLGGIAKGHAVDQGIQILKDCGIEHAIVTAGGDSRILGDKKGRPWMMGIQHPRDQKQLALALPLTNSAISTSGDYERFFFAEW